MNLTIKKTNKPLMGTLRPESDKSISQRLILFSLLTNEECVFEKISRALDPKSALIAASLFGLEYKLEGDTLITKGPGFRSLQEPSVPVYCGNSGTLMRFLMGLLAPSDIFAVLTGDESLNKRPMARIADPLKSMGAEIFSRTQGFAPLAIKGTKLKGINYTLPVASAQLKTAILLATLNSEGTSTIIENTPSRDHSERILLKMGAGIKKSGSLITIEPKKKLSGIRVRVGGDFSSAAFFIGAGLLSEKSEITLEDVNLNPTRTGLIKVLERMGAKITIDKNADIEPNGNIYITSQKLFGTTVESFEIPTLIDEIPLLAVICAAAEGETVINGVFELTVKESDRLSGTIELLSLLGRESYVSGEGKDLTLTIKGVLGSFSGGEYDPRLDHRLAMAAAIAGINSTDGITIKDSECAKVSQPEFYCQLQKLGAEIKE